MNYPGVGTYEHIIPVKSLSVSPALQLRYFDTTLLAGRWCVSLWYDAILSMSLSFGKTFL